MHMTSELCIKSFPINTHALSYSQFNTHDFRNVYLIILDLIHMPFELCIESFSI